MLQTYLKSTGNILNSFFECFERIQNSHGEVDEL